MNFDTLSPFVRVALDYTVPQGWELKERIIFDYELLFVRQGNVSITVDDTAIEAKPGDFVLIRPGQSHSMKQIGDVLFRHPHIHFDFYQDARSKKIKVNFKPWSELSAHERFLVRQDCLSDMDAIPPNPIRLKNPAEVLEIMEEIIRLYDERPHLYEQKAKGLFITLWIDLLNQRRTAQSEQTAQERMDDAAHFIEAHLHRQVTTEELAQRAQYSPSHFMHLFKETHGLTPQRYQIEKRMAYASELLEYSRLPISEIAERCGYATIHAFSAAFKTQIGQAPTAFRSRRMHVG